MNQIVSPADLNGALQPADQVAAPEELSGRHDLDEIAVVVPVYMGKSVLRELCNRLVATLSGISEKFSIILVDDRSRDNPWPLIQELGREDHRIRGIQLSKNFGQHYALTAGIDYARAHWYVVMDCDLQDAPEDIPRLYKKAQEGYDVVVATRRKEGHGILKRYSSHLFYTAFNLAAGFKLPWSVGNFRIFSNNVAEGFRQMREQMRFLPASFSLMGFDVGEVELPHLQRKEGKSSYSLMKLIRLAGGTVLAHSQTPLKIAAALGLCIACLSIVTGLWFIARTLIWGAPVTGWTSLIVSIFLVGGIQIFITGVVGIYVGKCFEEAKGRPLYFVKSVSNL